MFGDAEKLFTRFLHLDPPWKVSQVDVDDDETCVRIEVVSDGRCVDTCPECGCGYRLHGIKTTEWMHSDLFDMECRVRCTVEVLECPRCGRTAETEVPWSGEDDFKPVEKG